MAFDALKQEATNEPDNGDHSPFLRSVRPWLLAVSILIAILAIGGITYVYVTGGLRNDRLYAYTIPGVPVISVFNHTGENASVTADAAAAMLSVMDYWLNLDDETFLSLAEEAQRQNFERFWYLYYDTITDFIEEGGELNARVEELSLEEVKDYINDERRMPLLVYLRPGIDAPEEKAYSPLAVLIGIDEGKRELIFHHFWYGPDYRLSFDDFRTMQRQFVSEVADHYVVVEPKEGVAQTTGVSGRGRGLERSEIMDRAVPLLQDFLLARAEFYAQTPDVDFGLARLMSIVGADDFETVLHPYFRVIALTSIADTLWRREQFEEALSYAEQAIALNHDLEQPFNGWEGYEVRLAGSLPLDRQSRPYQVLGDIHVAQENTASAKDAYETALAINPGNLRAREQLEAIGE